MFGALVLYFTWCLGTCAALTGTGPLLHVKKVNGTSSEKGDNQKLWGNLAVRDMKKWQGIHRLMRADIAFQYNVNLSDTTNLK